MKCAFDSSAVIFPKISNPPNHILDVVCGYGIFAQLRISTYEPCLWESAQIEDYLQ